jgi:hypothetical protein
MGHHTSKVNGKTNSQWNLLIFWLISLPQKTYKKIFSEIPAHLFFFLFVFTSARYRPPSQAQVGQALTQGMPPPPPQHSEGVITQLTIDFLTAFCL